MILFNCPHCDGTGEVFERKYTGHGNYEIESFTCEYCDGLGEIYEDEESDINEEV